MLEDIEIDNSSTLLSLIKDNPYYASLIELFEKKAQVTSVFFSIEEFIQAEISRVKTSFIQPSGVKSVSGGIITNYINFTEFVKQAYELLEHGHDSLIVNIISQAKSNYVAQYGEKYWRHQEFQNAIVGNLKQGVALMMYQNFLKSKLISLRK